MAQLRGCRQPGIILVTGVEHAVQRLGLVEGAVVVTTGVAGVARADIRRGTVGGLAMYGEGETGV